MADHEASEERVARLLDDAGADDGASPEERALARRVGAHLADGATWEPVPDQGVDALLEVIAGERDEVGMTGSAARWLRLVAVAAAVVVFLGVGVALLADSDDAPERIALGGGAAAPGASAELEILERRDGLALLIWVHDLPPAPAGSVYAAWMIGPDGVVPVGSFHLRGGGPGPIELWSGVMAAEAPDLIVTRQPVGETEPSEDVVLAGSLALRAD